MARGRSAGQGDSGSLDALLGAMCMRLGETLGRAVAAAIAEAIKASGLGKVRASRAGQGARSDWAIPGRQACLVPNCGRPGSTKGLCGTHYAKARRLKMGDTFTQAQLEELAKDGRKARFEKKAA